MFVVAFVFSLFSLRSGIVCALAACVLSWPFFAGELSLILGVWRSLLSVVHYSDWGARLAAVLMLIVSSVYSLSQSRLLFLSARLANLNQRFAVENALVEDISQGIQTIIS